MKNTKYLRWVILSICLSWIVFWGSLFYQIGAPTESSRWIYEINQIKSTIAHSIKSPKILMVSGSNGLFGISCKLIQEETGIPCVNAGTHAGLGIDYILNWTRSLAKSGDLVLLPLEYIFYLNDSQINDVLIDYVFARDPGYFYSKLNALDKLRLIAGISFERLLSGIIAQGNPPAQSQKNNYDSQTINEYGDETKNQVFFRTEYQSNKLKKLEAQKLLIASGYVKNTSGMKTISEFIDMCRKNKIQVIATWSTTVLFAAYKQSQTQAFWQSIADFYQQQDVPMLGKPKDFMYEKSMYYDTREHLNARGMLERTRKLLELLKPYLEGRTRKHSTPLDDDWD